MRRKLTVPHLPNLTDAERREVVNQARMEHLLELDLAPWVHATTMAEIELLAGEHGLTFSQAYKVAKQAKQARYPCLRSSSA